MPGLKRCFRVALFAGDAGEKRLEQFQAVRPPRPRTQTTELAFGEIRERRLDAAPRWEEFSRRGAPIHLHKLRQREARLLDAAQKFHRRFPLHQHDVVLPTQKLRQVREIARQLRLMLRGIERLALRDAGFGERIENKNARRAAFGLRIDVQFRDELRRRVRRRAGLRRST